MVDAQDVSIVRRVCPSCSVSHRDICNLLDTLKNNWFDQDNEFNMDFALYSTYLDGYLDANRWKFCNFNDPGVSFPRDCGPVKKTDFQWNSYTRAMRDASHHAFLIPADPDFKSDHEYLS